MRCLRSVGGCKQSQEPAIAECTDPRTEDPLGLDLLGVARSGPVSLALGEGSDSGQLKLKSNDAGNPPPCRWDGPSSLPKVLRRRMLSKKSRAKLKSGREAQFT